MPVNADLVNALCQRTTSSFFMIKINSDAAYFGGWHDCSELLYVMDGVQYVGIGGNVYEVRAGDMLWIAPYIMHVINPNGPSLSKFYSLHYTDKYIFGREALPENPSPSKYYNLFRKNSIRHPVSFIEKSQASDLGKMYDSLYSVYENENDPYRRDCLIRGNMLCILAEVGNCASPVTEEKEPDSYFPISEICLYIEQNIGQATQEKTAAHFGYSRNFFSHCFHEEMGISYMEYVKFVKMNEAVSMLVSGSSIQEISETLGYSSTGYFSRILKNYRKLIPESESAGQQIN